jgi:hypothetical protein
MARNVVEDRRSVKIEAPPENQVVAPHRLPLCGNGWILASTAFSASDEYGKVESFVSAAPVNVTFTPPSHS